VQTTLFPSSNYEAIKPFKTTRFVIVTEQYLSALRDHRAEPLKAFVMQRTQVEECACEIRNPSGQCCLANFKRLENEQNTDVK
jgi:hypothetical protein